MNDKLLVVCDNSEIRKTIMLLLGTRYEILEAATRQEALRMIGAKQPRLMLVDMTMPVLGGLKVLKAVQDTAASITSIMLTSETNVKFAKRALELGATEYITKPFDWNDLRNKVKRSMEVIPTWLPWRTVIAPAIG